MRGGRSGRAPAADMSGVSMTKKHRVIVSLCACLAACMLMCALAGCGRAAPKKLIRFGYIAADQLHSPAVMAMKEKKLLEAAGFDVEWKEFLAGSYVMRDMEEGAIDYAVCGAVPVMSSYANDNKLAIVAGANQEGSSLIVNDSIRGAADLNGAKIGTPGHGSIQEAMVSRYAGENGVDIKFAALDVTDMPLFLEKGEIDGFIAWAPHPAKALSGGIGHELLTSRDMMPGHQCCVFAVKESALLGDRDTVKKVLQIYLDAYKWFLENRDESVRLMSKYTGADPAVIRQALDTVNYVYPPYCNEESMAVMARSLIDSGRIAIREADLPAFLDGLYQTGLLDEIVG